MKSIEVCFSPKLYHDKLTRDNFIAVVTDVFRATTSICSALEFGVEKVIPVAGLEEARNMKKNGALVACERNGKLLDFADIGNSPSDFHKKDLSGKEVVFSTTNGTQAIKLAANDADEILIGSFLNVKALAEHIKVSDKNVVVLCAAWKNLFNLEDTLFAGALSEALLSDHISTECDSTKAAVDLWHQAKFDLPAYLSKSSHRNRLRHLLSEEDYQLTLKLNSSNVVPIFKDGKIKIFEKDAI